MVNLVNAECIRDHLQALSAIVDLQEKRSMRFPEATLQWLKATEDALQKAGLSASGGLSALRSRLLTTLHGNGAIKRSPKATVAMASQVITEAQAIVRQSIEPVLNRLSEAEQLASRLVAVARAKGILQNLGPVTNHQMALQQLYSALRQDSDTASALVHITGLVGPFDALVLLDRAAPELN